MGNYEEIQRQDRRDRECREAYEALTPEQRAMLAKAGIDGADMDREPSKGLGREEDAAVLVDRVIGVEVDFAGATDKLPDLLAEQFDLTEGQAEGIAAFIEARTEEALNQRRSLILARIVGFFLLASDNLQARAHGLAHAARMAERNGLKSLRHSARICGVSPEWLRRVAWRWCKELDLPPLENAKTPEACEAYRQDKLTNHHRTKKCTLPLPPLSSLPLPAGATAN